MAQLKVKQISDFVSAVASVHNGAIGTGTVTGISIAKSEAIASALSSAEAKDVVRANATAGFIATAKGEAVDAGKLDATSKADAAEAAAILAAENKDVVRASATTGFIATAKSEAISTASGDASAKADAALNAAVLAAENKDVARATATAGFISDAKGEAIAAGEADATSKANAAQANAIASAEGKDVVRAATAAKATVDAQAAAILAAENKDVVRAEATVGLISDAKGEAINAASADATSKANAAQAAAATEAGRLDGLNAVASTNYTDGRETSILSVLRGEISSLAGTDKLEQIATFTNKTSFSLAEGVKLDNLDVLVYVNGLQIHRSAGGEGYTIAAGGQSFAVEGLGYELEENDHIVVIGIKA